MHALFAYIRFLFRSTNQHGVHSPFVYNLVTKCFYDRKEYSSYKIISDYRETLLASEKVISVRDFGAGSKVFSSEKRKISALAKIVGISPKRARLLNRLVGYLSIDSALELGTSLGIGTAAMAAGNSLKITTIEGCSETAAVAGEMFKKFGFNNIQLKVGEFELFLVESGKWTENDSRFKVQGSRFKVRDSRFKVQDSRFKVRDSRFKVQGSIRVESGQRTEDSKGLRFKVQGLKKVERGSSKLQIPNSNNCFSDLKSQISNLDSPYSILTTHYSLLYIDGNHTKAATMRYFNKLLPYTHNDSVMIFDDIHWSKEMEEAWEEIKNHTAVTVSIDTFSWGFVFFRREQEKEHFVIRL